MTEAYYNDTLATEFSLYRPSPGLLWRWLRQEIIGQNSMHGHAMAVIGNLTQYRGEVWNYPVYQYRVTYAPDPSGGAVLPEASPYGSQMTAILGMLTRWAWPRPASPTPLPRSALTRRNSRWIPAIGPVTILLSIRPPFGVRTL